MGWHNCRNKYHCNLYTEKSNISNHKQKLLNMRKTIVLGLIGIMLFSACKKEDNGPPPLNSTSMKVGKAGIRFTANTAFNGNKNFDVVNTNETSCTNLTLSSGTIRKMSSCSIANSALYVSKLNNIF